ncbi:GDSL-type esterase/lipase family protein [Kribbella sp. NPDC056345]|uniref:GDSL-type esterase/lipase family protein n=1 Tax=Kribbella sp. NPDC056345 TaxID=3345789 RepID=UPI0035D9B301
MITTPITIDLVRGALELEPTERGLVPHRLPAWARRQYDDDQLAGAEAQPSGMRLAFRTRATVVELDVIATKRDYLGAPPRPDGVYDLVVDGVLAGQATTTAGDVMTIDLMAGTADVRRGASTTVRFADLGDAEKAVEIWLPHDENTELVALRTDAPIAPVATDGRRTWVHHGSSISHGSNALSPTGTWPALAAAQGGVELINLGFSGSAVVQPFVARTIRDLPTDLISVKLGINVVNSDSLRLRTFVPAVHGFLDTIRDGHPTTPLLVISPILCPIHEDTPGPTGWDLAALAEGRLAFVADGDPADVPAGKLTLTTIRTALAHLVAQRAAEDPNLHYLDGRALYGEADTPAHPLPDDLHPDADSHRLMAERFSTHAFTGKGPFAGPSQVR